MAAAIGNKYSNKYSDKDIEKMGKEICDYAEHERTAHFAPWARRQKKSSQWMYEIANNYPKFKEAFDHARELMAAKLLTSSIYKDDPNFNPIAAMAYLGVYDKNYREYLKYKADIAKKDLTAADAEIIVNAVNYANKSSDKKGS